MIDLLCELGRPFQVPRSVVDQLATLERAERAFAERHGRLASPEELQAATKLPVKAMPKLLNMRALVPVALDASALGDGVWLVLGAACVCCLQLHYKRMCCCQYIELPGHTFDYQ